MTTLRAPGETRAAYAAFRWPGDDLDRRAWLGDFKLGFAGDTRNFSVSVAERDAYRGWDRRDVANYPPVALLAYDDEHVLAFPEAHGPVTLDAQGRLERLVATRRGETPPYHCYHDAARTLVERLPTDDIVYARIRADDGTFGSGARASAFTLSLDGPGRDTASLDGPGRETDARTDTSREAAVDLGMTVVFPAGRGEVRTVREHVRDRWTDDDGDGGALHFRDPSYERTGRVVTVSERRPIEAVVG